jgi:hypothetical protein
MPISIDNYLLDQTGTDWPTVLEHWSWLLPDEFTLWLVNRFCDLFMSRTTAPFICWTSAQGR